LINDLSFFHQSQLLSSDLFNVTLFILETSHLFFQLPILVFNLGIHFLDPIQFPLKPKEVEDPLVPEEGEDSQNQKKEKDQKKKMLFSHRINDQALWGVWTIEV